MGSPFHGEAAISPGVQVMSGMSLGRKMHRHGLLAMTALLTFAAMPTLAIKQRSSRDKRYFARALLCRDHMFSQALQLMVR